MHCLHGWQSADILCNISTAFLPLQLVCTIRGMSLLPAAGGQVAEGCHKKAWQETQGELHWSGSTLQLHNPLTSNLHCCCAPASVHLQSGGRACPAQKARIPVPQQAQSTDDLRAHLRSAIFIGCSSLLASAYSIIDICSHWHRMLLLNWKLSWKPGMLLSWRPFSLRPAKMQMPTLAQSRWLTACMPSTLRAMSPSRYVPHMFGFC